MQSVYKWHSKLGIEKIDVILKILQDLKEEIKELEYHASGLTRNKYFI